VYQRPPISTARNRTIIRMPSKTLNGFLTCAAEVADANRATLAVARKLVPISWRSTVGSAISVMEASNCAAA